MYAFCFPKAYPFLQPHATRALQKDSQLGEGVRNGVDPEPPSRRKKKRKPQENSIMGMESLYSVFMTRCGQVAEETESAE